MLQQRRRKQTMLLLLLLRNLVCIIAVTHVQRSLEGANDVHVMLHVCVAADAEAARVAEAKRAADEKAAADKKRADDEAAKLGTYAHTVFVSNERRVHSPILCLIV